MGAFALGPCRRAVAALLTLSCLFAAKASEAQWPEPGPVAREAIAALPQYQPRHGVTGNIRLWGHGSFKHDFMRKMVDQWIAGFSRHHPQVTFDYQMFGTASAVGAIYTGAGDVAILGEEISPAAARAFLRARGYPHTDITIATGSIDVNYFDYAHMIFVHRDNPIEQLSLPQLAAIFGAGRAEEKRSIRHWGELGLGGEWKEAPINPHAWKTDVDFALFFRERVLAGDHRWNNQTREYVHQHRADGSQYDHGQKIVDALAADRHGIAISNTRYANAGVKLVPLSWTDEGPAQLPNEASLISQAYPLTRLIPAIVNKPPDGALEPAVAEFLHYILSREGQQILATHSGYLPLSAEAAMRQRKKLE